MSVGLHPQASQPLAAPKPLFYIPGVRIGPPYFSVYDVDPSGQRFLVRLPLKDPRTLPLTVLVHWTTRPAAH